MRNRRIANGLLSFGAAFALIFLPIVSRSQAQSTAPLLSSGVHLQAELLKPIDAERVHVGDQVIVRTVTPLEINGQKFPSGATVIGHITQVEPSRLALLFDQIATKKNTPVAMRFSLRAVMMPHTSASQISPRAECGNCGNGAVPGTDTPRSSGMLRSPEAAAEDSANTVFQGPAPVVKTGNGGVVGLTGVNLSVSDDPKVAAVFESAKGHALKLDKGLQIMFVVSK